MKFYHLQVNGWRWRTSSKEKLGSKSQRPHVLSCMWNTNTNTSNIIYTYKYIQNMYQKVGLVEEMKGRGIEGKKDSE
jgi:hypothetical protein